MSPILGIVCSCLLRLIGLYFQESQPGEVFHVEGFQHKKGPSQTVSHQGVLGNGQLHQFRGWPVRPVAILNETLLHRRAIN